jgi:Protein of unknown function (DUF3592)
VPYILGLLVLASGLVGLRFLFAAAKWAAGRRAASSRALKIDGTIIGAEKKNIRSGYTAKGERSEEFRAQAKRYAFHPKIAFTTPEGVRKEFVANCVEIGETSPYVIGSTMVVRYDPMNAAPPTVDTFAGLWGPSIAAGCGGLLFMAVSIGLGCVFYAKVIAG